MIRCRQESVIHHTRVEWPCSDQHTQAFGGDDLKASGLICHAKVSSSLSRNVKIAPRAEGGDFHEVNAGRVSRIDATR